MITGIRHIGYNCSSIPALEKFYRDVLGFELIWNKTEDSDFMRQLWSADGFITTRKYKSQNGIVLEFGHKPPHLWHLNLAHIGVSCDNIEEEYKRLVELGYHFISRPIESPDGNALAICFAPDGMAIELVEVKKEWMETGKTTRA